MEPKTTAQDSDAAAAQAKQEQQNRPQDSFYETSAQAAKALGLPGDHSLRGAAKMPPEGV